MAGFHCTWFRLVIFYCQCIAVVRLSNKSSVDL